MTSHDIHSPLDLRQAQSIFHRVRSRVSSFNFHYFLVSLRSSSSCLRFPSPHSVPFIFPSKTCLRRQLPRSQSSSFCYMWYIPFLLGYARYFISHTIVSTDLLYPTPTRDLKPFKAFLIYFLKCSSFSTTELCSKCSTSPFTSLNLSPIC